MMHNIHLPQKTDIALGFATEHLLGVRSNHYSWPAFAQHYADERGGHSTRFAHFLALTPKKQIEINTFMMWFASSCPTEDLTPHNVFAAAKQWLEKTELPEFQHIHAWIYGKKSSRKPLDIQQAIHLIESVNLFDAQSFATDGSEVFCWDPLEDRKRIDLWCNIGLANKYPSFTPARASLHELIETDKLDRFNF